MSEAEVKEAWLASCRAIYEVQPQSAACCSPVLLAFSALTLLNMGGSMACMQLLCKKRQNTCTCRLLP